MPFLLAFLATTGALVTAAPGLLRHSIETYVVFPAALIILGVVFMLAADDTSDSFKA
jgi:hypothetical protein